MQAQIKLKVLEMPNLQCIKCLADLRKIISPDLKTLRFSHWSGEDCEDNEVIFERPLSDFEKEV